MLQVLGRVIGEELKAYYVKPLPDTWQPDVAANDEGVE